MSSQQSDRLIVSCDGCGTPYPAVSDDDGDRSIIGEGRDECPNCGADEFSRMSL